jgi:hypothetical protein
MRNTRVNIAFMRTVMFETDEGRCGVVVIGFMRNVVSKTDEGHYGSYRVYEDSGV